ncbi:TPA: hypothetical protein ACLA2K_000704 [Neisseria meningitidis]|uniref:hypothetical protein n=1 Tax=Neisseria meningitidis TaxID=487 RepID=UPI0002DF14ED|nr:hypothetical protein [Neisseria meningitidis]MBJ1824664.1 hypothetical protein [Neisseria meningitidis]MCV6652359.1 hypothetical protein [Neisseria meningitidis]MCV6654242.1 hypothetical protein [Neisseria meningitidis]MCV6661297.1 hypothetical protein [Neisseria meningitidis]MCV6673627.1 hypothetical protein [Neisseria meningitidis]
MLNFTFILLIGTVVGCSDGLSLKRPSEDGWHDCTPFEAPSETLRGQSACAEPLTAP